VEGDEKEPTMWKKCHSLVLVGIPPRRSSTLHDEVREEENNDLMEGEGAARKERSYNP